MTTMSLPMRLSKREFWFSIYNVAWHASDNPQSNTTVRWAYFMYAFIREADRGAVEVFARETTTLVHGPIEAPRDHDWGF